jgi:hypothetical protein
MRRALFLQQVLHSFDGHTLFVEQELNPPQQKHICHPIVAPPPGALHGSDGDKFAFPKPKDMRLCSKPCRNFAYGSERIRRFGHDD